MKWNLPVDIKLKPAFKPIEHSDCLLSMGSCFSEHIGSQLQRLKWPIINNPFGILYNPLSIHRGLERILSNSLYRQEDLTAFKDMYYSMDHHGRFSHKDPNVVLAAINAELSQASDHVKRLNTLIVTFGTAYYYRDIKTGTVVGNCHKMPEAQFQRDKLDIGEICQHYKELIEQFQAPNQALQWVFTVSPVRHWKDGAIENQRSKSILHCAIQQLETEFTQVHYFPSYEIMMDELRDHRFYADDLIHPNSVAIEHIWNRFSDTCLTTSAKEIAKEIENVIRRDEHRPLHPNTVAHQNFLEQTSQLKSTLQEKYPYIKF